MSDCRLDLDRSFTVIRFSRSTRPGRIGVLFSLLVDKNEKMKNRFKLGQQ